MITINLNEKNNDAISLLAGSTVQFCNEIIIPIKLTTPMGINPGGVYDIEAGETIISGGFTVSGNPGASHLYTWAAYHGTIEVL